MIKWLIFYLKRAQGMQRINMALARAATTAALRQIDPTNPSSWEFSGFSQNGEDGIIDFLTSKLKNPNRYFLEIGSSDGFENNTTWLSIAKKYNGLMIEGDLKKSDCSREIISPLNLGVACLSIFVSKDNVQQLKTHSLYIDPDIFSLDIDGCDFYIAQEVMDMGFRPKIFVVEYNSAFGPHQSITIKYKDDFNYAHAHESHLYFGVSITGWKNFFDKFGYKYVTCDLNGVDAFFINPLEFDAEFVRNLKGLEFRENFYLRRKFRVTWEKQFERIQHMDFVEIT
jgi:hypothetical protein